VTPSRTEAFSDGVFSIAATLLVLDLKVPAANGDLLSALTHLWPAYASYAVSFLTIGIIWMNHHTIFAQRGRHTAIHFRRRPAARWPDRSGRLR
jgi:uncharacterized membrane protein